MKEIIEKNNPEQIKKLLYIDGKIYFSRTTERKFFFILTMIMLIAGIFSKIGLF